MTTLYDRVAGDLRRRIQKAEYPAGSKLPSEAALVAQYNVSMPTLRMALERLQLEGLIEKFHGKGNYVRQPYPRISYGTDRRAAENIGLRVFVSADRIEAQDAVAKLLGVPTGTRLIEYSHLSFHEDDPYCLAKVYVPTDLATTNLPGEPASPWGDQVERHLAEAGVPTVRAVERVKARTASGDESRTLRMSSRAAVLEIERTSTDTDGRVVVAAVLVLPGNRSDAVFTTYTPVQEAEAAK